VQKNSHNLSIHAPSTKNNPASQLSPCLQGFEGANGTVQKIGCNAR
jgi:hypothetical protein